MEDCVDLLCSSKEESPKASEEEKIFDCNAEMSNPRPLRKRKQVVYRETCRQKKCFELIHSPVSSHVHPILSAAQRSAKRIAKRAREVMRKEKSVRFLENSPGVIDITPRAEKRAGAITMPNSPPFPYSRTTFFNLLVRRGIVSDDDPKRTDYIKADIELAHLGISAETEKELRDLVEAENRKENYVFEKMEIEDSDRQFATDSTNVIDQSSANDEEPNEQIICEREETEIVVVRSPSGLETVLTKRDLTAESIVLEHSELDAVTPACHGVAASSSTPICIEKNKLEAAPGVQIRSESDPPLSISFADMRLTRGRSRLLRLAAQKCVKALSSEDGSVQSCSEFNTCAAGNLYSTVLKEQPTEKSASRKDKKPHKKKPKISAMPVSKLQSSKASEAFIQFFKTSETSALPSCSSGRNRVAKVAKKSSSRDSKTGIRKEKKLETLKFKQAKLRENKKDFVSPKPQVSISGNSSKSSKHIEHSEKVIILDGDDLPAAKKSVVKTTVCTWDVIEKRIMLSERDWTPFSLVGHIGTMECSAEDCLLNLKALPQLNFRDHFSIPRHSNPMFSGYGVVPSKPCKKLPGLSKGERAHFTRAKSLSDESKKYEWCTVLRPRSSSEILGNTETAEKIRSWLFGWRTRLERKRNLQEEEKEVKDGRKQRKRKDESDSDDEYIFEEGEDLCNTLLLSGPHGCGKTGMVYAIAEELGMAVMVSAADEKRNGASLKAKLEGALDTHRFASSGCDIRAMLFSKIPVSKNEVKVKEQPKCTIILIEDADLSFLDESSFWPALTSICLQAKVPVIISCTDWKYVEFKASKENVDFEHYEMRAASAEEIAQYIRICLAGFLSLDLSAPSLIDHAKSLKCDLRACINRMQFYGSTLPKTEDLEKLSTEVCAKRNEYSCQFYSSLCANRSEIESSGLLRDEFPDVFDSDSDVSKEGYSCVQAVQFTYPTSYFYSSSAVATEILPLLQIMDVASREESLYRRRSLHHFDRSETSIDSHGEIRRVLCRYNFPKL